MSGGYETVPNFASAEHRLALLSGMVDMLVAVAVEFFHGDERLMWSRLGPDGKELVNQWAELRRFDATGQRPDSPSGSS